MRVATPLVRRLSRRPFRSRSILGLAASCSPPLQAPTFSIRTAKAGGVEGPSSENRDVYSTTSACGSDDTGVVATQVV
jgi:hypothetical protein